MMWGDIMNIFSDTLKRNNYYAKAEIRGSMEFPNLAGVVYFYPVANGTLVRAEITGLPAANMPCGEEIFGFHIHEGDSCTGDAEDPFKNTGGHYNPKNCPHPAHAGDMPPLFGNNGIAWCAFYTDRFTPDEVVGKTVIIHDKADDFKTQPSGDAGTKIACGKIVRNYLSF